MTQECIGGIWVDVPGEDAIPYRVVDPVTGDEKTLFAGLGETCTIPGTHLDVHQQDQADALYAEIFPDAR